MPNSLKRVKWLEELNEKTDVPLASVDVERSFSIFKNILSDRRHSFTEQNLKQTLIVNCFHARMI